MLLGGFAQAQDAALLAALAAIVEISPFRYMETPGGWKMSVAMTNCGAAGWVTDRAGYRYGKDSRRCRAQRARFAAPARRPPGHRGANIRVATALHLSMA